VVSSAVERKVPAPISKPCKIGAGAGDSRRLQLPIIPTPENRPWKYLL